VAVGGSAAFRRLHTVCIFCSLYTWQATHGAARCRQNKQVVVQWCAALAKLVYAEN
jgi:hypothetical protein